jgi:hypothetical protein
VAAAASPASRRWHTGGGWWGDGLRHPLPFSPVRGGDLGIFPRHEDARGSSLGFDGGGGLLLHRRWSAMLVALCGGSWDLTQVSGNGDLVRGVMAAGEN